MPVAPVYRSPEEVYDTYHHHPFHTMIFGNYMLSNNPMAVNMGGLFSLMYWFTGGANFVGILTCGFLANSVSVEPFFDFFSRYQFDLVLISWGEVNEARMKTGNLDNDQNMMLCVPAKDPCSWKSWKEVLPLNYFASSSMVTFTWLFQVYVLTIMPQFVITDPDYLLRGEEGMLSWLSLCHMCSYFTLLATCGQVLYWRCWAFRYIFKKMKASKHLMSAAAFKTRSKFQRDKCRQVMFVYFVNFLMLTIMCDLFRIQYRDCHRACLAMTFALAVLLPLVCRADDGRMPSGVALQVYGASWWASPLDALFHRPGQQLNLLGGPLYMACFKMITFAFYCYCGTLPNKDPTTQIKK